MARGKEFTDRLFASRAQAPSGTHEFDQFCAELGIEHRLTPPKSPQTNGMVERFNGRISDVLKTNRFDSALDLEQTLMRGRSPFSRTNGVHGSLYNTQLPQSALGSRTPMRAMKDWHKSHPHLFVKTPRNRPGRDKYGHGTLRTDKNERSAGPGARRALPSIGRRATVSAR